jgi:hypothetical protein
MYCTFLTLKARNDLTLGMSPDEFTLKGEKKLFQAYVSRLRAQSTYMFMLTPSIPLQAHL